MLPIRFVDRRLVFLALVALLIEFWMFFSDIHFIWKPSPRGRSEVRIAQITSTTRGVKVRPKHFLSWSEIKTGYDLFEGDEVMTGSLSEAVLHFLDGHSIRLAPSSVIVLTKGSLSHGQPSNQVFTLTLVQGSVQQDSSSPSLLNLPSGEKIGMTQVEIQVGSQKIVSSNRARFRIESTSSGEAKIVVSEGNVQMIDSRDKSIILGISPPRVLPPTAPVKIGIRTIPLLDRPVLLRPRVTEKGPAGNSPIVPPILKRPLIHYPREESRNSGKANSFGLRRMIQILDVAENFFISSAEAAEAVSKKFSVDLEWEKVAGAQSYLLQIATDSEFKQILGEQSMVGTKTSWETDIPGFYYWRVKALGREGQQSSFSEFMVFEIKAKRNLDGEEVTYDSYLLFDAYAKRQNIFRLYYGPMFLNYYFSSTSAGSPNSVILKTNTFLQAQMEYNYWLSPYYSAYLMVDINKNYIEPGDFESAPLRQRMLVYHETEIYLGIDRRFFQPKHYFNLKAGILISYLDCPVLDSTGRFSPSGFGYFGPYFLGGIHKKLFGSFDFGLEVGGLYQSTGSSFRFGQMGILELKKSLSQSMSMGLWFQERWTSYRVDSSNLIGAGHSLTFWPMLFSEFIF